MSADFFLKPALAGLSLGAFCLSYCFPFLASFITSENRKAKKNLILILYFIFGRFLGYMIFGILFGYLGEQWNFPFVAYMMDVSMILISIVLILYLTGLIKQKESACLVPKVQNQSAFTMGFLLGVNICPPFLLSLTYVFSLHNMLQGVLYFLIFFCVSSIYFLPMIFVGMLAKMKELQTIARLSGIACACLFIIYGCYSIINRLTAQ